VTFNTGLDSIKCPACGLTQFFISPPFCRRCAESLGVQYMILTLVPSDIDQKDCSGELAKTIGHMMRTLRLDRGLTQAECAMRLHTSRSHLSRVESGRLSPSFSMLLRVAHAFGCDKAIFRIQISRTPHSKQ